MSANPIAKAFSDIFTGEPLRDQAALVFASVLEGAQQRRIIQQEITPDNAWVVGAHSDIDWPAIGLVGEFMIAVAPPVVGHPLSPTLRVAVYALAAALNEEGLPAVDIPVGKAAEILASVMWLAHRHEDAEALRAWSADTDCWSYSEVTS